MGFPCQGEECELTPALANPGGCYLVAVAFAPGEPLGELARALAAHPSKDSVVLDEKRSRVQTPATVEIRMVARASGRWHSDP